MPSSSGNRRERTRARSRRSPSSARAPGPSGQAGSTLRAERSTTTTDPGATQPVVDQQGEHLLELRVLQGVRRVGEHHVVRRPRVADRAHGRPAGRAPRPCGSPSVVALSCIIRAVRRSDSTEVTTPAPRDIASSPMAPEPAYRSRKRSPVSEPSWDSSAENSASRTRSAVGRVASPVGVLRRRPPAVPPMIRVMSSPGTRPARSPRGGGWPRRAPGSRRGRGRWRGAGSRRRERVR